MTLDFMAFLLAVKKRSSHQSGGLLPRGRFQRSLEEIEILLCPKRALQ
jgi:hypothetical protein